MLETEFYFASQDGTSQIRALLWEPDPTDPAQAKSPQAAPARTDTPFILQIMHGMAEHIERYRNFAEYCTNRGIIVCGHDHIGHGKSVSSANEWGHMPFNGKQVLIEDAHQLRLQIQERFQRQSQATVEANLEAGADTSAKAEPSAPLPYVLFGHSMGSFVLRLYLAEHATGIAAAIISGTGQQPALLSASGSLLARLLSLFRGINYKSPLLYQLSVGAYAKQIENAQTPLDWLSTDEAVVAAYIAAPDCGFLFDNGANYSLTSLTGSMVKPQLIAAIPLDLPLLFIAGADDPVGEKGAGVKRAVQLCEDTGHTDVSLKLYEGMRHEVLNERGRQQVYDDILKWAEKRVAAHSA